MWCGLWRVFFVRVVWGMFACDACVVCVVSVCVSCLFAVCVCFCGVGGVCGT